MIEPGNNFLAGCGFLGEVSCEGTREVGLFWRDALGWPLVWDQDEETAVQSPAGGTKVSWGGPPVPPKPREEPAALRPRHGRSPGRGGAAGRARCDRLGDRDGGVELGDPDGNEFSVASSRTGA